MDEYVPDTSRDGNPFQSISDEVAMRQRQRLGALAAEWEAEYGPAPEAERARIQAELDRW